ncbi:unnamed protein product [Bursaphelenchus xylophilus]|uniref:(pine wood nematode) hypothetical protein n=1 Tax=Bursaphelenchus xylophilus TaxID=6326 RepID=A0A7I8X358_BURXY|nr:unnamed protein product [Bursaphelenchus xylophilus]CAG9131140.1 unnamed protein product [Bursaphelenchus xylophilus]
MWKVASLVLLLGYAYGGDDSNFKLINNHYSNVRIQGLARGDVIKFTGTLDVIKNATAVFSIIDLETGKHDLFVELNNAEKKIYVQSDKGSLQTKEIPPGPKNPVSVRVQVLNYNVARIYVGRKVIGDIETGYIGGPKYFVTTGNIRDPKINVDEGNRLPIYKRGIDFRTGDVLNFDVSVRKSDLYIYLLADEDLVGYALKTNLQEQSISFSNNQGDQWGAEETYNVTNLRQDSIATINNKQSYVYPHQIDKPESEYRTLFVDSIDASVRFSATKRKGDDSDEDLK